MVSATSWEVPASASTATTRTPSESKRASIADCLCAMANNTSPPSSCQACASARQRITWPVPMATLASARTERVRMLTSPAYRRLRRGDRHRRSCGEQLLETSGSNRLPKISRYMWRGFVGLENLRDIGNFRRGLQPVSRTKANKLIYVSIGPELQPLAQKAQNAQLGTFC